MPHTLPYRLITHRVSRLVLLVVVLMATVLAAPGSARAAGAISGTVSNIDGEPIAGVTVNAFVKYGSTGNGGAATTDAAGRFSVGDLIAGNYALFFAAGGAYLSEYGGHMPTFSLSSPVAVTDGQATTYDMTLVRMGTIRGQLMNLATAAPISGASVAAFCSHCWMSPSSTTAADGRYAFKVPEGTAEIVIKVSDPFVAALPITHTSPQAVGAEPTTVAIHAGRPATLDLAFGVAPPLRPLSPEPPVIEPPNPPNPPSGQPAPGSTQDTLAASAFTGALQQLRTLSGQRLPTLVSLLRSGRLSDRFIAPRAGSLTIAWRLPGVRVSAAPLVAKGSRTFRGPGAAKVVVRLTRRGRTLLRGRAKATIRATATFTPTGATAASQTARLTLRGGRRR